MKMTVRVPVEVELNRGDIAYGLMAIIQDKIAGGVMDDAGCDWFAWHNRTYIGNIDWLVSEDPNVAALVKAFNILQYGHDLELPSFDKTR